MILIFNKVFFNIMAHVLVYYLRKEGNESKIFLSISIFYRKLYLYNEC